MTSLNFDLGVKITAEQDFPVYKGKGRYFNSAADYIYIFLELQAPICLAS